MSENVALSCTKVSVDYGSFRALDEVSFDVKTGQITALLGPSGSYVQLQALNDPATGISRGKVNRSLILPPISAVSG